MFHLWVGELRATFVERRCLSNLMLLFFGIFKSIFGLKNIKLIFLVFFYYFDVLISKIKNKLKKKLFWFIFKQKTILKSTLHHNLKHSNIIWKKNWLRTGLQQSMLTQLIIDSVFRSVVIIVFQNILFLKMYQNNIFFYF